MIRANAKRWVIAGGGTGGHLFPGIAVAEEFMRRQPANRVLFVGTNRPMETALLHHHGFAHQAITAYGIKGLGLRRQAIALVALPAAIRQAQSILRAFQPHLVLGVGGYSAGPVGLAAALNRIPLAIHEQNLIPGITNRLLAPWADLIFLSTATDRPYFRRTRTRVTGNPIRRQLLPASHGTAARPANRLPTLLVLGGSQGADIINRTMIAVAPLLKNRIRIIHQTGAQQVAQVARAYAKTGIDCTVKPFFYNMAVRYQDADLIVSRAGATTLAEMTALGKPAILIPFAQAADNHQMRNARWLAHAGAADYVSENELEAGHLAARIQHLILAPQRLTVMASQARKLGRPAAALKIVQHGYRLMAGGK